jgi:uncharacterized repeat protein (TIGR03803 family)
MSLLGELRGQARILSHPNSRAVAYVCVRVEHRTDTSLTPGPQWNRIVLKGPTKMTGTLRNRILDRVAWALVAVLATVAAPLAQTQTFKTLYTFTGGLDGSEPGSTLLLSNGNLLGTTPTGGAFGLGTIFSLNIATGQFTVLHAFAGAPSDGGNGGAELMTDSAGNLYGTTQIGGSSNLGTVYKLDPSGTMTLLHSFSGLDGEYPEAGVVMDAQGNLYGTCEAGGTHNYGTVFKLGPTGTLTILHNFTSLHDGTAHSDGAGPWTTLRLQGSNLYGTTLAGGDDKNGTVFMVNASTGKETLLYNFPRDEGPSPPTAVIGDGKGNLCGTAGLGYPGGAVYMLNLSTRKATALYVFSEPGADGTRPMGVMRDSQGDLYGTTYEDGAFGYGTVFELDAAGNLTTLYNFTGGTDGAGPLAGVIQDSKGNLYGTASDLYVAFGTIFEITPLAKTGFRYAQ